MWFVDDEDIVLPRDRNLRELIVGAQPAAVRLGPSSSVTATAIAADQVPAGGWLALAFFESLFVIFFALAFFKLKNLKNTIKNC